MKVTSAIVAAALAATTLVVLPACSSNQSHRSTSEYVDDATLTARVKTALIKDPDVKAYQINVETYNGVVSLSGFVDSEATAQKAVNAAQGVNGVRSVKNDLHVKSTS
jgi:hyperosmotically inducible periplasmic protein